MNLNCCLEKLRLPTLGTLLGVLALGISAPSAKALDVQGCIKLDGKLTQGVRVEAFSIKTCTSLLSTVTDRNGDFVLWSAAGRNQDLYLQVTAPDGCIEIVDNTTVCNSIVTDPNDPRFGWVALCVDMKCKCVPCTTGVAKVVLQYLGTTKQPVTIWATATASKTTKTVSKNKTVLATPTTCALWSKTGHKAGHYCVAACQPSSGSKTKTGSKTVLPATPLFAGPVAPCTTFTVNIPVPAATGSKAKTGSKSTTGTTTTTSKTKTGSKAGKGTITTLTAFVGNNVNTRISLNCASGIVTNGQVVGMFRVIRLENAAGQRICPTPPPVSKGGNCITSGKPNQLTFQYVGGNCSTAVNSQPRGQKYNCTDSGSIAAGPVRIVVSSSATPTTTGFFAANVNPNETFTVRAGASGSKSSGFGSNTYAYIYSGGVLVERIQIHTSCSAPLVPGETFGALKLVTYAIVP